MIGRSSGKTFALRPREATNRRWSIPKIVFASLAFYFAVHSANTVQLVKQLAEGLEGSRRRLQEAEAGTAGSSNATH